MFQFKVLSRHLFSFSFSSPYKKITTYYLICFDNLELTYKFHCVKLQYVLLIVGGEVYIYIHISLRDIKANCKQITVIFIAGDSGLLLALEIYRVEVSFHLYLILRPKS